jgi:hypothetical protein
MSEGRMALMQFEIPNGGEVILNWPDDIKPDIVDLVRDVINLQCDQIKRMAAFFRDAPPATGLD